jgi:hypothetical protein
MTLHSEDYVNAACEEVEVETLTHPTQLGKG